MKKFLLALFLPIYIAFCLFLYSRTQNVTSKTTNDDARIYTFLKKLDARKTAYTTSSKKISTPPLSVESIFSLDHSFVNNLPSDKKIVILATGDVIPSRSVNFMANKLNNFKWPYEKTFEFTKNADITFINLEAPLLDSCPITNEGMIFCGSSRNVEGLVYAGVDIASLANNHAGNHGVEGVEETKKHLKENGIEYTGISSILYKTVKGTTFAFLGFNDIAKPQPGVRNVDEEKIKHQIQEARQKADIVIVAYHWGVEYRAQPDDRQIELGHLTIDAGADLIIGNHPHWIQPIEIYKGKLITYAHGNFVFDQMWSQKTEEGIVGKYTFYDKKLVDVEFFPIIIKNYGQPYFPEEKDKKRILDDLKQQSLILSKTNFQ